jgi:predicted phage terminase large subunit-like protein
MTDYTFVQEALLRHFTPDQVAKGVFDKKTRLALAALDFEFFCRYYLSQHFDQQPASFHATLFADAEEMLEDKEARNYLGVVFRGGGKTTIFNLAMPLWCLCLKKRYFTVIISDSERMAREKAAAIKFEMDSNDRLRSDFGDLTGTKWADTEFEVKCPGSKSTLKVLALGSGMNVRGTKHHQHRPDLIILDDVENRDEVASPAQRARLLSWFLKDVSAAGQPDTKLLVLGTYLSYDCVLKEIEKTPIFWRRRDLPAIARRGETFAFAIHEELWEEWSDILRDLGNHHREQDALDFYHMREPEMLEGVEVTWPERFPYYDLMVKRLNGRTAFNTEYLNEPSDPDSRFFNRYFLYKKMLVWDEQYGPWLVPWSGDGPSGIKPVRVQDCALFAATDPSLGQSVQADYSAIIIIALDTSTGYRYILEADIKRRTPAQIIRDQIEWYKKYPQIVRWTIETVQMQMFFKEQAGIQSLAETSGLPLVDYKGGSTSKHIRIQSLQSPLENGYLMICDEGQELLREQFEQYLHTAHDDGPDATQMCYVISLDFTAVSAPAITEGQPYRFGEEENSQQLSQYDPYAAMDAMAEEAERADRQRNSKDEQKRDSMIPIIF